MVILENVMANAYIEIPDNTYKIRDDLAYIPPNQNTSTHETINKSRKKRRGC
jgi:hypothetical protein